MILFYRRIKSKKWYDKRSKKIASSIKRSKKYDPDSRPIYKRQFLSEYIKADIVVAPENICLFSKTGLSLQFFKKLRQLQSISKIGRSCFVQMDLSKVKFFDYSSICVLIAISQDLKSKKINLRGNFPKDKDCRQNLIESGLLTFMYDNDGKRFPKSKSSDLLFIEKGSKRLTRNDNIRISKTISQVVEYLTGTTGHLPKLRTVLLEICGNSIEWGGTQNNQWLLGVRYIDDKVIFTVTDVGKGILKTLNRKFGRKLRDAFGLKNDGDILKGAFEKKYGSRSQKVNRNKGLPSIKRASEDDIISNLKVITNKVLLDYSNGIRCQLLESTEFKGTLYQWELTSQNIR